MKPGMFARAMAGLALATSMSSASAGFIVSGATITSVANTSANQRNFSVSVTGGSGPCTETTIIFPEMDAADAKAHQRAYATALLAFTIGGRVSIYNYFGDDCTRASFIHVIK